MDSLMLKESLILSDRSSVCRLCLSTNGVTEPIGYGDQYLLQKIYECTSIQITATVGMPSVLCTICRARLEDFYQFRWQCIKNDEIIHRIVMGAHNRPLSSTIADDKHIQEADPDYLSNIQGFTGMAASQTESKPPQQQGTHTVAMGAPEYSPYGQRHSHTMEPFGSIVPGDSSGSFRRKRGRPPKQQFDVVSHLIGNKQIQTVGEQDRSSSRLTDSTWSDGQSSSEISPHVAHEPSSSSNATQESHEWYKIKLEQIDHQVHTTESGQFEHSPAVHQHLDPLQSNSSEHFNSTLSRPDAQVSPGFLETGIKRGRGRPPREGGCPNADREEYRYRCQYCSARFKAAVNLKLHTNTHTGEKPYLCTVCNKSFAHPSNLSVHMKLHSNRQQEAGRGGLDSGALKENGEKMNPPSQPEKRFQCPYCHTFFALAFQLKIHINTHTGQKPYVCKSCGKGFAQPSNLHVHGKKHCRRKVQPFAESCTGGATQGSGSVSQPVENTPTPRTTDIQGSSQVIGRISCYQDLGL